MRKIKTMLLYFGVVITLSTTGAMCPVNLEEPIKQLSDLKEEVNNLEKQLGEKKDQRDKLQKDIAKKDNTLKEYQLEIEFVKRCP
jgi:septal ring factor EnvC (AmiA/AmiB activator)